MNTITGVNIALRAVNEPAVANVSESPLAEEAEDLLEEIGDRIMASGPWWFQDATHIVPISAGNSKPFTPGETIIEATSAAELQLRCIDRGRLWFTKVEGTPTGGVLLTAQTSEATRTGGTLITLSVDDHWDFDQIPDPFAQWIAREAGLELERTYKRGSIDDKIISAQVERARVEARDWDRTWATTTMMNQPDVKRIRTAFQIGASDAEALYDNR